MVTNPNGPYPGRQLFLGLTTGGRPAFAYLVSGRNPQSRERKAVRVGDGIRIGPLGQVEYDPLRHYTAVKVDELSGIVAVSNGIQTDAIFEAYRLLFNTDSAPARGYMKKLLDGARAEPDSYHTPRIAGIITYRHTTAEPVLIVGIKTYGISAGTFRVKPEPGELIGVSTYQGEMEAPRAFDIDAELPVLRFEAKTAEDLAEYLFDISAASYNGDDIRVCAIGGVCSFEGTWNLHIINRHQD
ncbi:MAG TPA: hypothetical protein G4O07_01720 [Dehalococcoidia bacterium]|nr:hypothetical protein [Dehalococcoidia bacterium]